MKRTFNKLTVWVLSIFKKKSKDKGKPLDGDYESDPFVCEFTIYD
jgi:hypothetical protein